MDVSETHNMDQGMGKNTSVNEQTLALMDIFSPISGGFEAVKGDGAH